MLRAEEITNRLNNLLQGQAVTFAPVLASILANNKQFPAESDLVYMEVFDANSLRKSFDINCYKKGLHIKDLLPAAMQLASQWSTSSEFEKHIQPFMDYPLGHVSGGINRQNIPFLTLYFELP